MISGYTNSAKVPMSKRLLEAGANNKGLVGRLTAAVTGAFLVLGANAYAQNVADPNVSSGTSTNTTTLTVSTTATTTSTSTINTNVVSLHEYEAVKKDRDVLRDERDNLLFVNCELEDDYNAALQQIRSIEGNLKERSNTIKSLEGSLSQLNEQHKKLRDQYGKLEKNRNEVGEERDKLRKDYREVTEARDKLSGELKAQKREYQELSGRYNDLNKNNAVLNSSLSEAKGNIKTLEGQVSNLTTQVKAYQQHEAEVNTKELARRVAEEQALKEGALVYQFTTSPAYTFPEFPWATAIFGSTLGDVVEVTFDSSVDGRFIDSIDELRKVAEGVSRVYKATFPNRTAFEQLAADAGMDANFVYSVEGGSKDYTIFDALAQMVHDYDHASKANPRNPVVISIDDKDQAVVFGSYETLKRVKGGSL